MATDQAPISAAAPPHDLDAESSVLGAILLSDKILDPLLIDVGLKAEDFYRERHRLIYRAMLRLKDASESIDPLTLTADLRETGDLEEAGGGDYVHGLVGKVPALANTRQYGQIVKENALLRNLLRASHDIQSSIANRDGDPRELLEQAQQRVFEVAHDTHSAGFRDIGDVLHDELEKLEQLSLHGSQITGTTSGFRDLDELTGGFQPGNLIIIAARPSMGKSALVTNIAENAALKGDPVALFSLEMSQTELAQRFIASQAKIDNDLLRKGRVRKDRWPAVLKAAQALSEAPLWIDDSSDVNILELRAKARRLDGKSRAVNGRGLGLIIVDYLQLLRANDAREGRVEQVSQMSRGLKILARELNVPVIAVSQLSRQVESRTPPTPVLSDLRESGQIEQDADLVMFIYREEYYKRGESERPGEADVIISKHRNGPIGEVVLTFMSRFPKFLSMPKGHARQSDAPSASAGASTSQEPDLDEF